MLIQVVRGAPTAEETAALVAVLALRRPMRSAPAPRSRWAEAARPAPALPGRDGWRRHARGWPAG